MWSGEVSFSRTQQAEKKKDGIQKGRGLWDRAVRGWGGQLHSGFKGFNVHNVKSNGFCSIMCNRITSTEHPVKVNMFCC